MAIPAQHHRPLITALLVAAAGTAPAFAGGPSMDQLKSLSVEQLLSLEVTSVSKRPEKLLEAPAAVELITSDDIRRSGAASIPDALRLANNLDVAQKNAHEWVVSARGFSSDVGNKLLVLFDGRSVYTPLFSGVFWDRQDYILDDIDRIEVISGPGGSLWGANAVNGVINIVTKEARDTQGLLLEASGGTDPQASFGARYGGSLADGTTYRVYGKYSDRDSMTLAGGGDANDAWRMAQGGFRVEQVLPSGDGLTVQGDLYRNKEGIISGGEARVDGANILGRWTRTFDDGTSASLQAYYDRTHLWLPTPAVIFAPSGHFQDTLDTYDLDFHHRFLLGASHHILWGLGFRRTQDMVVNSPGLAFFPQRLNQDLYSGFLQDEIDLRSDLVLTVGTKVEHNDYTGFEVEPNVRLQWSASERQSVWAAVSRAVRMPSRIDRDISQPDPAYFLVLLRGGQDFESETLVAYEAGYRAQLGPKVGAALSTFYNVYDDVRSTSVSPPDPLFNLPFPFYFQNNLQGETYGFELSLDVQPLQRWRLHGAYRLLKEDIHIAPGRTDFNNALNETSDPQQQLQLRSSLDLPGNVEFDAALRWIDTRRVNNAGVARTVPDYLELEAHLGWHPSPAVELSVAGENLLHDHHPEYGVPTPTRVELGRRVYFRMAWQR